MGVWQPLLAWGPPVVAWTLRSLAALLELASAAVPWAWARWARSCVAAVPLWAWPVAAAACFAGRARYRRWARPWAVEHSEEPLFQEELYSRRPATLGTELLREKPLYCGHRQGGKTELVSRLRVECPVADMVASLMVDLDANEPVGPGAERLRIFQLLCARVPASAIRPTAMIFHTHLHAHWKLQFPWPRFSHLFRVVQAYARPTYVGGFAALGLFPSTARVPHSCEANVFAHPAPSGELVWRPLRALEPDEPWRVSWLGDAELLLPTGYRHWRLETKGALPCKCTRCTALPERTVAYACACGASASPAGPWRGLREPGQDVLFECDTCGKNFPRGEATKTAMHYAHFPGVCDLADEEHAAQVILILRHRVRRVLGLHPAEAALMELGEKLRDERPAESRALRKLFFGRKWREAAGGASPWGLPVEGPASAKPEVEPDGAIPDIEIDGPAPRPPSRVALVSRVVDLAQAGRKAAEDCQDLAQATPSDAWKQLGALRGLVAKARGEREQLASVAVELDAKRRTVATVLAAQGEQERALRRRAKHARD